MSKPSNGNWKAVFNDYFFEVRSEQNRPNTSVFFNEATPYEDMLISKEEAAANTRLFAASRDLLECCELLLDSDSDEQREAATKLIRDAVYKAKHGAIEGIGKSLHEF